MFLKQAMRYRPWQTAILVGVSVLIGGCAAFGPWFARAVEQSVTTFTLHDRHSDAAWLLSAVPTDTGSGFRAASPENLDAIRPEASKALFEKPVLGHFVDIDWKVGGTGNSAAGRLTWREDFCRHLRIVAGSCPTAPDQVTVSTADRDNFGLRVGSVLASEATRFTGKGALKVTGIYQAVDPREPYWYGVPPVGRSSAREAGSRSDAVLTPRATFDGAAWSTSAGSTADTAPLAGTARVGDLQGLVAYTADLESTLVRDQDGMRISTGIQGVVTDIDTARGQATTIIPLVMVQVALFGLVVLALAAAAVIDQRRPEIALSRLRGRRPRQAALALVYQLGWPALAGALAGVALAFGLLIVVRRTWLAGGAPAELPWTVPAAAAAAVVAALGTIVLAARAVVRQPVATLLRTVPPRRRSQLIGLADLMIITVAAAGLFGTLTGNGRGPLAILTPTLLALAAGLAAAHLMLAAAGRIGPAALRSGRLAFGLGALQVARRTAVTRIVAVIAVASALVAFAGQASSVATRNRDARAGYEIGAAGVLDVATRDLPQLRQVIDRIDRDRRWLTPVVVASSAGPGSLATMMVEPDSFLRIGYGADKMTDPATFDAIRAPRDAGIELRGRRLELTAQVTAHEHVTPPSVDGVQPVQEPPATRVQLAVTTVTADGSRTVTSLGNLMLGREAPTTLSGFVGCDRPCRLLRISVHRAVGDAAGLHTTLEIVSLRTEAGPVRSLGSGTDWSAWGTPPGQQESIEATSSGNGGLLGLDLTSFGTELAVQHRSAPAPAPALIDQAHPISEVETMPGLDGVAIPVGPVGPATGPVPRQLRHVAVTDLATIERWGGQAEPRTRIQLWLSPDGVRHADDIGKALAANGIGSSPAGRIQDQEAVYARSASALALRLTPVIGTAAWSLALIVLLLLAVTTWRSRAYDHAGLRITGVPAAVTAGAARWEQTAPVALAVLLGTACGLVGAHLALPLIPLFSTPLEEVPVDLGIDWSIAVLTWLVTTALLTTATVALGVGLGRRATYARITEEVQ